MCFSRENPDYHSDDAFHFKDLEERYLSQNYFSELGIVAHGLMSHYSVEGVKQIYDSEASLGHRSTTRLQSLTRSSREPKQTNQSMFSLCTIKDTEMNLRMEPSELHSNGIDGRAQCLEH